MKLRITLLVAALACGLQLSAQDKTIYVNLETIFENFYKTINANIAFEDQKKDFEARLGLIREEMQNLEKQAQRYNEEVQNDLLPRETRETSQRSLQAAVDRLRAKKREYDQNQEEGLRNLQRIRMKREEDLVSDILSTINKYADEAGATHVIEVSGKTFNRVQVYLRYPKEKDVTQAILKLVNLGHEDELAAAKAKLDTIRAKANELKEAPAAAPAN
ncbi:MAG: OmpH family outer membrane protein [Victivallales bacterium]|jgi:Skp family chaperone for outer membrane proteins|nr:OmpH family outer membrane protein [Victivallales bacterium]MBR6324398.1 OmpH family outer membrane protein [Victivallales bacterium]